MPLIQERKQTPLVALVGNPNAGKTTVFNALTGAHQKVGNYPGVTVERISGELNVYGTSIELVDVPGLYSLSPASEDERVAVEVIRGLRSDERKPDLYIVVIDANNLERNLFFFSQIAELNRPMVAALTMTDVLSAQGYEINVKLLEEKLGVPVCPVVGHKGVGIDLLQKMTVASFGNEPSTEGKLQYPEEVHREVVALQETLSRSGFDFRPAEIVSAVLGVSDVLAQALEAMPELAREVKEAKQRLQAQSLNFTTVEAASRYIWASRVHKDVLKNVGTQKVKSITVKIDRIATHRVYGMALFFGLMYVMFQAIYTFATPLMNGIQSVFSHVGDLVGPLLAGNETVRSLVVDGLIGGVGTVVTFLPQILILFFFVAVLEGTGYLSRAAFMMDRLLSWCGLNGRAFIPLLSSFACAVPGVMAARVMPDPKSRLTTILVSPLMSCSARLPVYLLMIGAFIEPTFGPVWAGVALFVMHLVGLGVAIPMVWLFNKGVVRGKPLPFLLELPPYQAPKWRDVILAMYFRGKVFLKTAGTVIIVLSVVVWALLYFPRSANADAQYRTDYAARYDGAAGAPTIEGYLKERQIADSYLGRFGKTIEPAFKPAGFDWRLSTAILAAFPAREVLVSSLGIIFSLGGDVDEHSSDLRSSLQNAQNPDGSKLMTPWTAVGLMVFFALCAQCMATLATVRRETNSWKWPIFMFVYMTTLAYLGAVAIHQISKLF